MFGIASERRSFYNCRVKSANFQHPPNFVIKVLQAIGWCLSKLCWRIKFQGLENIPDESEGGLLIAANHQTYMDPVWVCLKVDRAFRFMAWDEIFNWFLIGRFIRYLGAFPVGLNRRGFVKATRVARQVLHDGATLVIFPEGEREFSDGKLLPFKVGAIRLVMETGVPILPVTIRGANRIWAQDMKFPRPGKVEIIYHPVFRVPKPQLHEDIHAHIRKYNEQLMQIISSQL